MPDVLGDLLRCAERLPDGIFTPRDVRVWPGDDLAHLASLGVLAEHKPASEIWYDGCDHECAVPNSGFEKHPDDPDRLICVHRCLYGCGLVLLEPRDFEQWRFSLLGLARAVASAIGAAGTAVEDVPGRVVLVGTTSIGGQASELFLGLGLSRTDAAVAVAAAGRLAASEHPVVLSVGVKPGDIWSGGARPRTAVLAEHARLDRDGIRLDLAGAFPATGIIEIKPDSWLTVTQAGELLKQDLPWLTPKKANARVSKAAGEERFRTNGKKGAGRRIDRDSFSTWRLQQRDKDLEAEG